MEKLITCRECNSLDVVKNGSIANGKQKYKCKECGIQFVLEPKKQKISEQPTFRISNEQNLVLNGKLAIFFVKMWNKNQKYT